MTKFSSYDRFYTEMHVFETAIFGAFWLWDPFNSKQVANPLNQYIFRKYIPWPYSSFLNFSKIFHSKKAFFVPPVYSQIVKMLNFDPLVAPSTFGAEPGLPIFVIRVHGCIHHISLVRIRDTFAIVRTLVSAIRGMALKIF